MVYEFYFTKLTSQEQNVYRKVLQGLQEKKTAIPIFKSFDNDHFYKILNAVHLDHPELFYVEFHSCQFQMPKGYTVYLPTYYDTGEALKEKERQMETVIGKLVDGAKNANLKSDLQKCRWIHDKLVRNIVYGYKAISDPEDLYDAHTIEGVFLNRKAVCEGISLAFKLLGDRLGLETMVACGNAGMDDGEGHAWNICRIDQDFVQVDATWDGNLSLECRYYRYDYFALSDLEIQNDHEYTDFLEYPICATMKHSYFFRKGCLLKNPKEVESFLDRTLREGESTVYFRVQGKMEQREQIMRKVTDLLRTAMGRHRLWGRAYEDLSNEAQLTFFYKIL